MAGSKETKGGRYVMNTDAWPAERWAAVVVLGALGVLVLLRMGFRGINVMGANVSVG